MLFNKQVTCTGRNEGVLRGENSDNFVDEETFPSAGSASEEYILAT